MREEQIFAKTLEELSALAKEQGNMLSEEQVTEAFDKAKLNLGEPQLEMIFAYLKNKKIGIGQPADPFDYMTQEEIDYLEEYLKAVQAGADVTDGVKEAVLLSAMAGDADAKHRMIEIFLPQVAEIAKLYAGPVSYTHLMEQLFFHLNVLCSDGTDLLYGVRQLYERKEQTGEIARVKGLYQSETMTDAIRLQGMLWETLAGFLEQAKLDGEELKEHSPLIGQMFELAQNPVSVATHVRTLAQQLHVSESTLTRRFRAETGISPGEYLERLVAGQACRMLLSEDYSLSLIHI